MKTIYRSDVLHRDFDSVEELEQEEKKYEEQHAAEIALKEEKKARAEEVTEAYKTYLELRAKFVEDYGSWHSTITSEDLPALRNNISLFDDLFTKFWW